MAAHVAALDDRAAILRHLRLIGREIVHFEGGDCAAWLKGAGPKEGEAACAVCSKYKECKEKAGKAAKPGAVAKPKKTDEEKAAEKQAKAAEKAAAKEAKKAERAANKAAGKVSKPGVIAAIFTMLQAAPATKEEILAKLVEQFPDRSADSMKATINIQIPSRLAKDKNVTITRGEDKRYSIAQ